MNLKRTATIGAAGGALAAWLAAAATSGIRFRSPSLDVRAPPIDTRGAELAVEIKRLHERLRPTATPRQPARNLFEFNAPKPRPPVVAASVPAIVPPTPPSVPAAPVLKLAGLAEDAGPDGAPVRTAIISGFGQLFLVKEGERVTSRYRVGKISVDAVELVDLLDSSTLRLVLK
jgi:hypothetical protein